MTLPRDRKTARKRYTDAKSATTAARIAHETGEGSSLAVLQAEHAELVAWDAYLAVVYGTTPTPLDHPCLSG